MCAVTKLQCFCSTAIALAAGDSIVLFGPATFAPGIKCAGAGTMTFVQTGEATPQLRRVRSPARSPSRLRHAAPLG